MPNDWLFPHTNQFSNSLTPTNFPTLWHQPSVLHFHTNYPELLSDARGLRTVPQDYLTSGTSGQYQVLSLPYFCPTWLQSQWFPHITHSGSVNCYKGSWEERSWKRKKIRRAWSWSQAKKGSQERGKTECVKNHWWHKKIKDKWALD